MCNALCLPNINRFKKVISFGKHSAVEIRQNTAANVKMETDAKWCCGAETCLMCSLCAEGQVVHTPWRSTSPRCDSTPRRDLPVEAERTKWSRDLRRHQLQLTALSDCAQRSRFYWYYFVRTLSVFVHRWPVLFCDGTSRYGVPENLTTG